MYGGGSASKLTAGALAGILAVGMIPAAAFAEDEAVEPVDEAAIEEVAEEAAIELEAEEAPIELQATDLEVFAGGSISAATDQDGAVLDLSQPVVFTAGATAQFPIPTAVQPANKDLAPIVLPTSSQDVEIGTGNYVDLAIIPDKGNDGKWTTADGQADDTSLTGRIALTDGSHLLDKTAAASGLANKSGKFLLVAYVSIAAVADDPATTEVDESKPAEYYQVVLPFEIKASALENAKLFEIDNDASDKGISDETFTWNSLNQLSGIGVKLDGKALAPSTDYTLAVYAAGSDLTGTGVSSVTAAGDYVAKITGSGSYSGAVKYINFKVEPLDLSKADITLKDLDTTTAKGGKDNVEVAKINGEAITWASTPEAATDVKKFITVSSITSPDGASGYTKDGEYTATLSAATGQTNVTGTGTFKFTVATAALDPDDIDYGSTRLNGNDASGGWTVNKSLTADNEAGYALKAFDLSKIVNSTSGVSAADSKKLIFTVTDADGKEYTGDAAKTALDTPGSYDLTVAVDAANLSEPYSLGGSVTVKVKVMDAKLGSGNVFATFDKANFDNADTKTVVFDGTDQFKKLSFQVLDAQKNELKEGTDYTVEYKKGTEKVTEAVNVDTYTATVKSAKYDLEQTWTLDVTAAPLSAMRIVETQVNKVGDDVVEYLPYTGSSITPTVEYRVSDGAGRYLKDADGNFVYATLPADAYKLTYTYSKDDKVAYAAVSEIKDEGFYKVNLVTSGSDASKNYTFSSGNTWLTYNKTDKAAQDLDSDGDGVPDDLAPSAANPFKIRVANIRLFEDVKAGEWYEGYVYTANDLGYMTGYKGTNLFKPNGNLTRAEAATVIWKMAGNTMDAKDEDKTAGANESTINTGFSDIQGNEWYAAPIKWAADAGVVNGYTTGANAGKFLPNATVTRQEFMTMLARYAKEVAGTDTKSDGKAMATKKDADKVASWAKDAVAWGVDGDMIGSNGAIDSNGKITRAQVAKITTVYQPEKLKKVDKA